MVRGTITNWYKRSHRWRNWRLDSPSPKWKSKNWEAFGSRDGGSQARAYLLLISGTDVLNPSIPHLLFHLILLKYHSLSVYYIYLVVWLLFCVCFGNLQMQIESINSGQVTWSLKRTISTAVVEIVWRFTFLHLTTFIFEKQHVNKKIYYKLGQCTEDREVEGSRCWEEVVWHALTQSSSNVSIMEERVFTWTGGSGSCLHRWRKYGDYFWSAFWSWTDRIFRYQEVRGSGVDIWWQESYGASELHLFSTFRKRHLSNSTLPERIRQALNFNILLSKLLIFLAVSRLSETVTLSFYDPGWKWKPCGETPCNQNTTCVDHRQIMLLTTTCLLYKVLK